jgi:hypothetical protein
MWKVAGLQDEVARVSVAVSPEVIVVRENVTETPVTSVYSQQRARVRVCGAPFRVAVAMV